MNVRHRQTKEEPINYNMRVLQLDKERILKEIHELNTRLQSSDFTRESLIEMEKYIVDFASFPDTPEPPPPQLAALREEFNYIATNLPTMFNSVVRCPGMNLDILVDMINGVFAIGNREVDPKVVQADISKKINDEFVTKVAGPGQAPE